MFHAITRTVQQLGREEECVTKGVDTTFLLGDESVEFAQTTQLSITVSTVGIQVSEMEKVEKGTGGYIPGLKDLGKEESEDGIFPLVDQLNKFITELAGARMCYYFGVRTVPELFGYRYRQKLGE